MEIKDAYNQWSLIYDTNLNKTRDIEALALREMLKNVSFKSCLEMGCGTGKNTSWLLERSERLVAVDFSPEMLAKAKEKIKSSKVSFIEADITMSWNFISQTFDLITFSLVLEHVHDLNHIFKEAARASHSGSYLYLGELHPFKQYAGTKARFENEEETTVLTCYTHNISDFISAAAANGFELIWLNEYFDDDDRASIPRILSLLFKKR
jgi:ubiquinone/menaquinone biosynthesis C-methylase UbiE